MRSIGAALVLIVLIALLAGCLSPEQQTGLSLVNRDRAAHGLSPLRVHGQLQAKAQAWAELLAREGGLRHSNIPDGIPSCWRHLGENIGYGDSIQWVENAYMNSPHHRENILYPALVFGAVGVATSGHRTYVVQEFMSGC